MSAPFRDRLLRAEDVATQIFSLPMYSSLTPSDQDKVIDVVRNVLATI